MVSVLRSSLTVGTVLIGSLLAPSTAFAFCISTFLTPTECDFKNEDTNLAFNQPAKHFIKNEAVERILDDSQTFIELYYNTTKTTGDAQIIADAAVMAARVRAIEATQVANTAIILANDPWNLKPIYTDMLCRVWWIAIDAASNAAGYPVGTRECPTTNELLINIQNIQALEMRAREIDAIAQNQFRVLGEVWGDVAQDIQRFRDGFGSPETFSHNLAPDTVAPEFDRRFASLEQLITNPVMKADAWITAYTVMDDTVNATVRDTLMATQANAKSMLGEAFFQTPDQIAANTAAPFTADVDELLLRNQKSRDAVGRMQQFELENMGASLAGQTWVDITQQQNAQGFMIGNDMAKEHATLNYQQALSIQYRKELHPIPDRQVFGNEAAYRP